MVKVSKIGAAARGGVKERDVLLKIDGCNIENDGTIDFRQVCCDCITFSIPEAPNLTPCVRRMSASASSTKLAAA